MLPIDRLKPLTGCLLLFALASPMPSAAIELGASPGPDTEAFGAYWYRGEAEITSYTLEQARYGEVHPGTAVLVFVTEDFSRSRQVKLDGPAGDPDDAVKVLKLNLTKKFQTGIYPYSMLSSVFTPVDRAEERAPLKITTSAQEWCGHTFTQLNRTDDGYRAEYHSYFEAEGDGSLELGEALPEDGLWTLVRLAPSELPIGRLRLVPGTMYLRLRHVELRPQWAEASLDAVPGEESLVAYALRYPDLERTLTIRFQRDFPHEIESWEESYLSGWGPGAARLTSRAQAERRVLLDYWNRHSTADHPLRSELGLD